MDKILEFSDYTGLEKPIKEKPIITFIRKTQKEGEDEKEIDTFLKVAEGFKKILKDNNVINIEKIIIKY